MPVASAKAGTHSIFFTKPTTCTIVLQRDFNIIVSFNFFYKFNIIKSINSNTGYVH